MISSHLRLITDRSLSLLKPKLKPCSLFLNRLNSSASSSSTIDYYKIFKNTFPDGPPPAGKFDVDLRALKKEFRMLQAVSHPDLHSQVNSNNADKSLAPDNFSSLLNLAYKILSNPLTRSQYLLFKLSGIDLTDDETSKKFQFQDQSILMEILDIHEELENIQNENDLNKLNQENEYRIKNSITRLNDLFDNENYELIALETVKLKYWYNIKNALKEWEAGKPVSLTH